MTYLLDTNPCVTYLRGKNTLLRARIAARAPGDLVVCSVVVGELEVGARRSADPAAELAKVQTFLAQYSSLPLDDPAAREYGEIRADLEARGQIIGDLDMMIAAIALVRGLKVVTHNTAEFGRIPGLDLEDWELP